MFRYFVWLVGGVVAASVALVAAVAIWVSMNTYDFRYRITVNAVLNGAKKSGSGVFTTRFSKDITGLAYPAWSDSSWGEAPVVDLGENGLLIAVDNLLIRTGPCDPPGKGLMLALNFSVGQPLASSPKPQMAREKFLAVLREFHDRYSLKREEYPQFAWMPDRNDRTSAKLVCPETLVSDTGLDLHIKSVVFEMTSDRPDGAIYEKLPWLRGLVQKSSNNRLFGVQLQLERGKRFQLIPRDVLGKTGE